MTLDTGKNHPYNAVAHRSTQTQCDRTGKLRWFAVSTWPGFCLSGLSESRARRCGLREAVAVFPAILVARGLFELSRRRWSAEEAHSGHEGYIIPWKMGKTAMKTKRRKRAATPEKGVAVATIPAIFSSDLLTPEEERELLNSFWETKNDLVRVLIRHFPRLRASSAARTMADGAIHPRPLRRHRSARPGRSTCSRPVCPL